MTCFSCNPGLRTSEQWLEEVLANPAKLERWLSRQWRCELDAAVRLQAIVDNEPERKNKLLLNKIAADEFKHAEMIAQLCSVRGIDIAPEEKGRYYTEVKLDNLTKDEIYAAGHFAEGMSLARIKAIVNNKNVAADIRAAFEIILIDEEMHEKAFGAMASQEAKDKMQQFHEAGKVALGLEV